MFHNEVIGGERFFDILEQMQKDLGRHCRVVELMYLCTSLGFEGRYRVMPRGVRGADRAARRRLPRRSASGAASSSASCRRTGAGIDAGIGRCAQRVPLWAIGLATLVVAVLMYLGFNFVLAGTSDIALRRALRAAAARRAGGAVCRAAPPAARHRRPPRRRAAAAPDLGTQAAPVPGARDQGRAGAGVRGRQTVTVRLTNRNMFGSGEATLERRATCR